MLKSDEQTDRLLPPQQLGVAAMVAAPIMLGGAQWAKRGVFFDFDSTMMLELSWGKMVL